MRFISDGCARSLEVARGLHEQLSPSIGTPIIGGAISSGMTRSKMFGVSTEKIYDLCELVCQAYAVSKFL